MRQPPYKTKSRQQLKLPFLTGLFFGDPSPPAAPADPAPPTADDPWCDGRCSPKEQTKTCC